MAYAIFGCGGHYSFIDALFEPDGVMQKSITPFICTLIVLSCYTFTSCLQYPLYASMFHQTCMTNSLDTFCIYIKIIREVPERCTRWQLLLSRTITMIMHIYNIEI